MASWPVRHAHGPPGGHVRSARQIDGRSFRRGLLTTWRSPRRMRLARPTRAGVAEPCACSRFETRHQPDVPGSWLFYTIWVPIWWRSFDAPIHFFFNSFLTSSRFHTRPTCLPPVVSLSQLLPYVACLSFFLLSFFPFSSLFFLSFLLIPGLPFLSSPSFVFLLLSAFHFFLFPLHFLWPFAPSSLSRFRALYLRARADTIMPARPNPSRIIGEPMLKLPRRTLRWGTLRSRDRRLPGRLAETRPPFGCRLREAGFFRARHPAGRPIGLLSASSAPLRISLGWAHNRLPSEPVDVGPPRGRAAGASLPLLRHCWLAAAFRENGYRRVDCRRVSPPSPGPARRGFRVGTLHGVPWPRLPCAERADLILSHSFSGAALVSRSVSCSLRYSFFLPSLVYLRAFYSRRFLSSFLSPYLFFFSFCFFFSFLLFFLYCVPRLCLPLRGVHGHCQCARDTRSSSAARWSPSRSLRQPVGAAETASSISRRPLCGMRRWPRTASGGRPRPRAFFFATSTPLFNRSFFVRTPSRSTAAWVSPGRAAQKTTAIFLLRRTPRLGGQGEHGGGFIGPPTPCLTANT